jgi:Protein of unknown function (DUF4011)/AAA domain
MKTAQADAVASDAQVLVLGQTIRGKLDRARLELLDLSTRNRLLSTPRRSRTARTIEIVDEYSAEIFRLLVREGRALTFAAGRGISASVDLTAADDANGDGGFLAQPNGEQLLGAGTDKRHSDTRLQTLLTSEALQSRLLNLYVDARTLEEEQGVNILYLALGFLKWFEAPNSDIERFSPLILIPVVLERGSAAERFKLRWTQEDPSSNLSLLALMRREHGLVLPGLGEDDSEEEVDPAAYFAEVAAAVADKPRWGVLADDIVLGFFSFAKFLMYRDLDPANWPKDEAIDAHPVIAKLLGDGFEAPERAIGEDENIDEHFDPARLIHVVDADSSQTVAIEQARHGSNLVIQGPPGTGKSQTIANVIAGAVADGKTVLFMAEKMAALDVVKRRLDNIGLGDTCLELHSNKTRKREVLQELKRTWELGKPNGGEDEALVRRLVTMRDALNAHAQRLHRRYEPSGMSAYDCIGHLVRLAQERRLPPDLSLVEPERWSRDEKEQCEQILVQLAEHVAEIGPPAHHPWRGVGIDAILRPDLDRLIGRIDPLRQRIEQALAIRGELCAMLALDCLDTQEGVRGLLAIAAEIEAVPAEIDGSALLHPSWMSGTATSRDS